MGAPAVALSAREPAPSLSLRALELWHLFSLDAPTVAFSWMLLFAASAHLPHAVVTAAALACAVWLVYAADRVLDARRAPVPAFPQAPHMALSQLYQQHVRSFLLAGAAVTLATVALLSLLPRPLAQAWLLLSAPLTIYAAAVHLLRLSARWKAVCVGIFFAVAVALPVVVHGGSGWALLCASLAFGGVCRANCAVLRAPLRRRWVVLIMSFSMAALPLWFVGARSIAPACIAALVLLLLLVRTREAVCERLGWLAWRALVDAALVVPAFIVTGLLLAR